MHIKSILNVSVMLKGVDVDARGRQASVIQMQNRAIKPLIERSGWGASARHNVK